MTQTAAVFTVEPDSVLAGQHLGRQIREAFHGQPPDAVTVFASSKFDHEALLRALTETCQPGVLVDAGVIKGTFD